MNSQNLHDDSTPATVKAQPCAECEPTIVKVGDIYEVFAHMVFLGAKIIREPGPAMIRFDTTGDFDSIALVEDVDGNRIKLVERIKRPYRAGIFL